MIVTFTVNNRPHYLAEVLESWREVRGVETVRALFVCEPGCPEAVALCERADFFRWSGRLLLTQRAGVLRAPKLALQAGLAAAADEAETFAARESAFAVLAEEDTVVSTDVLEYFAWAEDVFAPEGSVLAVTTCQQELQPGGLAGVRCGRFYGWVWGTWLSRWALIGPDWDEDYRHKGWDHRIQDYWVTERGYQVAAPCVSRSQHIGKEGGTHCTPEMFESLLAPGYQQQVPPQDYQLIP